MFDLLAETKALFSQECRYYETAPEANLDFTCKASQLPTAAALENYITLFRCCDDVTISLSGCLSYSYNTLTAGEWKGKYERFLSDSDGDDDIHVIVHINKRFDDRGSLSIYCIDCFSDYYEKLSLQTLLKELSDKLTKYSHLCFYVLDREVNVATESLCFYSDTALLMHNGGNRTECIKMLNDASLFLNRNEISLTPFDFRVIQNVLGCENSLTKLIKRLETVFSYLYLAYCGQFASNQIVLQLSPSSTQISLSYEDIQPCLHVCELFYWSFQCEHAIERTGLVRNLLAIHCKEPKDLTLDSDYLLLAAKSNYILYQKKSVDMYIELKNSISNSIVEATKSMQEILQTLVDAVRNNFVAVIVFLVTVILTDSVNWEDLAGGTILNPDLLLILRIFCVASFLYLLVTLIGVIVKWRLYCRSYSEIKANYSDLLDGADLENAFNNDTAKKSMERSILRVSIITSLIWTMFLLILAGLLS